MYFCKSDIKVLTLFSPRPPGWDRGHSNEMYRPTVQASKLASPRCDRPNRECAPKHRSRSRTGRSSKPKSGNLFKKVRSSFNRLTMLGSMVSFNVVTAPTERG